MYVLSHEARPEGGLDVSLVCFAPTPSKYLPPPFAPNQILSPHKFVRSKDFKEILTYHDGMLSWVWGSELEVNVWAFLKRRVLECLRGKNTGGGLTTLGGWGMLTYSGYICTHVWMRQ